MVHLIMVVNHPDILVLRIAKGPQYERRNKMAKLLKVALGIAVGEEDVRHTARPLHRVHFIAVELGASPDTGGCSVVKDFSIVAMGKMRGCLLLLLIPNDERKGISIDPTAREEGSEQ